MRTIRFLTLPTFALAATLLGGCSDQAVPAPQETAHAVSTTEPSANAQETPADVVQGFFDTLMANDDADVEAYLTEKSLAAMEGGESTFHGDRIDSFTLGATTIEGETARQSIALQQQGEEHELSLLLRKQEGDWRIHGFAMPIPEGEDWVIDFESEGGPLGEMAEKLVNEIGEGLEEAFEGLADEMAAGMENWQADWSAEQAREQAEGFDAMAIGDLQKLQPNWTATVRGDGRPASAVLNEILEGTGFEFDHGQFASRFEKPSNLSVNGISRIAALEALAQEVGLTPIYEADFMSADDSLTTLTWKEGARSPAMSFAGPYGVYIRELTENAPNPTAEIEICARVIGLGPEIISAGSRMFEVITVTSARGNGGVELLINPDQHWQTEPRRVASALSVRQDYDLGGLLRGIETIETVEGSVQLGAVRKLERMQIEFGAELMSIGDEEAPVTWTGDSFSAKFASFPLQGFDADKLRAHFAAWNDAGEPVHLTNSSSQSWNGKLRLQANFESSLARIGIVFYETEDASFPFQLPPHPLSKFEQQPASIASLQFEGDAPVSVKFRSFAADTNPDFPEADFELKNHSNKAVLEMSTSFVYRNKSGKELKDFPHTLQGGFDFDGHKPLTKPGETLEHRTVAFFRPDNTSSISVEIKSIEFTDGTSWKADE